MTKENLSLEEIHDSKDVNSDFEQLGFYIYGSKYYIKKAGRNGSKEIKMDISNFVGKSLYNLTNGTNNSKRILLIQRYTGEKYIVEIQTTEMKLEPFESILKSRQCTFYGNRYELNRIFSHWMDNESQAFEIQALGYNKEHNIFAFSNAIYCFESNEVKTVNEMGIVIIRKNYFYLPAFNKSNLNNNEYDNERKFCFRKGTINFKDWAKLYLTAYGSNGAISIQYLILSVFWDIVFDFVGFFPFLFLFGGFGTGKTSLVESLLRVFGDDYVGIALNNASQVGLSRTIASRNNSVFYLKEYTQDTDQNNQDLILTAYDGAGRTTGIKSNDNRTQVASIKSAIIFDGNHLPVQNSAVFSRMILLNFESNQFSDEQRKAYEELKKHNDLGLGQVIIEILQQRHHFSNQAKGAFDENINDLRKVSDLNFAERTLKHVALTLTPAKVLFDKLHFPIPFKELTLKVIANAVDQTKILKQSDELTIFWEAFAYNCQKGNLIEYSKDSYSNNKKNSHYRIKQQDEILQIRYQPIYQEYVRYCKNSNEKLLDRSSLKKLLTSSSYKPFIANNQKGRGDAHTDALFGSCYQFKLDNQEDNFSIEGVELVM